ncbi:MAG TPA: phenylalanine--tRNA ligase subunit beta [Patescibacteria group bacterium]
MNILIPHQWLLEHLDTKATPKEIQEKLSLCGPSVERIYEREGDSVYDIEVTTNRVDSMSVRGIAREAAVILDQFKIPAKLKPLKTNDEVLRAKPTDSLPLPKIVNDPQLCPRVMCVILKDVQRTPTPEWMATRLRQVDQNVHDSVIDITNYITHELGHPCHAFDYDKVMELGGGIIVKEAKAGKKFTTLDGLEYKTVGGEIVFENAKGEIIDLPGIKGTANTSINDQTKNVLLWIESIDAQKVRFASMTHAIRTVAAQLNEKNVDPELAEEVMLKGVELYRELCGAEIASPLYDEYPGKRHPETITVELDTISDYLGLTIPTEKLQSLLEKLECQAVVEDKKLLVTPPTFRPDLEIPADIIEEIARIYGYHNLPSKIMDTAIPLIKQAGVNFHLENKIKHFLADIGWQEVFTYSMVSQELATQSGYPLEEHLKLQNPLTDDKVYLRRSLVSSLNEVLDQNPNESDLSVFEIANVYYPQEKGLPAEIMLLSMLSNKPYRQVKGDFEALLDRLFMKEITITENHPDLPGSLITQSALIKSGTVELGTMAVLSNGRTNITLGIGKLLQVVHSHPEYQPIPKTTPVIEDLTFTLPEKTLVGEVMATIKTADRLIYSVELKDVYQQNFTFTVEYLDITANLSADSVRPIRTKVIEKVKDVHHAQLVGEL